MYSRPSLVGAVISAVNYSEVMKTTIERSVAVEILHSLVKSASFDNVHFDTAIAEGSAALFLETKAHGMSFADRACLAPGLQRQFTVLTAERKMRISSIPIKVKLVGNAH